MEHHFCTDTSAVQRVRRLPQNYVGRDFVVGDIHGAYDLVLQSMSALKFDGMVDRLLSVGDLIDRGLQSARCIKFLEQPYVHAIRGNHEQNLIEIFKGGRPDPAVLEFFIRRYSMEWIRDVAPAQMERILSLFKRLPIVMEIPTQRGLVGMVHGEVPIGMNWADFVFNVQEGNPDVLACALEGRQRISSNNQSGVQGIGRVFVGHTPQSGGARRYGNVYAVDTGAIFNSLLGKACFGMTMANLAFATGELPKPGIDSVKTVMTYDQNSVSAFGAYAKAPQKIFVKKLNNPQE